MKGCSAQITIRKRQETITNLDGSESMRPLHPYRVNSADGRNPKETAEYFGGADLPFTDSKTTLSANPKSQGAFARGQSGLATLGAVLDADVGSIKSFEG